MNLSEGKILINNIILDNYTLLSKLKNDFRRDEIEILKVDEIMTTLYFKHPQKIGSKTFNVRISFQHDKIFSINLSINDCSIDEYDYLKRVDEGSDWLVENIGYPQGILTDNKYEWGIITQWDDVRSSSAGIIIIYYLRY